jgi:hypothetical protein
MKKLFLITFSDGHTLHVAAKDWRHIGDTYESAKSIELIADKCEVLKDYLDKEE